MRLTLVKQLAIVNLVFVFLVASIAFFPVPALRIILGLPALLFFPGYVFSLALFPSNGRLNGWERLSFGFGLSIAVTALAGMALNYTPWGIRLYPVLLWLWFFVLAAGLIALYRQRRLPAEERLSFYLRWNLPKTRAFTSLCRRLAISEPAKLFPVLLLGYILTFIPHLEYPYPLHVDEWMNLAYFRAIQEAGSITVSTVPIYEFPDFSSGEITLMPGDVEPAFHVLWAIFQMVTEIPWLTIFRYFPGIVFLLTILSVYVFARREGYGLEAAFLASLIPSNVTMLGPSLLVPVALGMMFLPLYLLLILYYRAMTTYVVLAIFTSFLVLMHLPTAVILAIISVPFIAFQARKEWKHSLAIAASTLIPLLALSPLIVRIAPEFAKSFTQFTYLPIYLPYLLSPTSLWGYLPTLFFLTGVYLLGKRGENRDYSLITACLLLLAHTLIFVYMRRGSQLMYHRSFHYLLLMMSLIGGYALWKLRNPLLSEGLKARFKSLPLQGHWLRSALLAIIIGLILVETVSSHAKIPFYHMIDGEDYAAFLWIEQNVPASYNRAILDPWKATAFMALARREVYTRIQHAPQETDNQAYEFLRDGSRDTAFLKDNGITVVYSRDEVHNSNLVRVRENVFIFPEAAQHSPP